MSTNKLTKKCINCQKTIFKKQNCSIKNWKMRVRFCSKECHNIFRRGKPSPSPLTTFKEGHITFIPIENRRMGEKNNMWKGGQLKKVCKICSQDFFVDRYRVNAKTCSLECSNLYRKTEEFKLHLSKVQKDKISKELKIVHFTLSKLAFMLRKSAKYAIWRMKVLRKDDFTCQGCEKRGGKVQADHIQPFSLIILKNKIESYEQALACSELWDIDNGRTLCLKCHYKTPTFGSKVLSLLTKKTNL